MAVDGSPASHLAFEIVTGSLMKSNDKLNVGHSFNPHKTYLPFNMQPEVIKETYKSLIVGYGSRAHLLWEPLDLKS